MRCLILNNLSWQLIINYLMMILKVTITLREDARKNKYSFDHYL
jgi:hypothetical protein